MRIISNTSKLKNYILVISFSLIFTEFYFFNWKTQFFVSNAYLIFNTLVLFIFSLVLFFLIYLIYSKINSVLSENIIRIIDATIFSLVIFKLIQILFFYANIIDFKSLFAILLKKIFFGNLLFLVSFLKIILPYLLIFFFIFFLKKKYFEIIINFIISFSLVFFTFMVFDISKRIENTFYKDLNIDTINDKRKVIWLLLDEYDPSYIENKYGLNLKYTNRIIEKSVMHNRTFSPSDATLYSAPSTLMKTQIKNVIFEDFKMKILDKNNKKIDFNIENTIFNSIIDEKFSFQIFSEALPYCTMLRLNNNCEKNFNQIKFYFDGVINTLTPIKYFPKILEVFNNRSKFNIDKINNFNVKNNKEIFLSKELNIDMEKFEDIINEDKNLFYFHLFLPHTNNKGHLVSSKHIRDKFNMNAESDLEHYLMKLKYTDVLLNKIYNILDKIDDKEILLLVTSDHWRRVDSPNQAKPSLFVSKIFGDNQKYQLENDILNIFIPDLIIAFLREEIETHNQIKSFLKNLPFFDLKDTRLF